MVRIMNEHNNASDIGHPCLRYLVLKRTESIEQPEHVQKLFEVGKIFEEVVLKKLKQVYPIKKVQKKFFNKSLELSGVVDAILEDGTVLEIKSINSQEFKKINQGSFKHNHKLRIYYYQLQSYLFLGKALRGLFYFINRETGEDKIFQFERDEETIEEIKVKCKKVNEHVRNGTLPDGLLVYDICKDCNFYPRCKPEVEKGNGEIGLKEVVLSPELQEKLDRYYILQEQLKELKKLEDEIKETLREFDPGVYVLPERKYYIAVKEFKRKVLELPEDLKKELEKQYATYKPYRVVKIDDMEV